MPNVPAPPDAPVALTDASREIRSFLRSEARRRFLVPRAALVGLLAGLVAVAFRGALEWAEVGRHTLFERAHEWGILGFVVCILWGAVGAGAAVWLVREFAPEASGSGIPHLKGVMHRLRPLRAWRILPVKFVGGMLAIGSGLALGRQGPTMHMGGAVGHLVAERLKLRGRDRLTMIAAGAGAGLAAAFNAPLAGLVFVLEELQRDFAPGMFAATLVASIIADVIGRLLVGQDPTFHTVLTGAPSLAALPIYALLGVTAGLFGVGFNRALLGSSKLFARAAKWPPGLTGALVGGVLGGIGFFFPQILGSGHELAQQALSGVGTLAWLPVIFTVRLAMTQFSCSSGAAGGFFAPLLVLGAQLGLFFGLVSEQIFPNLEAGPQNFAVVGMAALFTATTRAPLTGIVLMIEMTDGYALIVPLLVAVMCAYSVADALGDRPIYEALLERDLWRGSQANSLADAVQVEGVIAPNSPFHERHVYEIELPDGCLLVAVKREGEVETPHPTLQLQAGDRLNFVLSPEHAAVASDLKAALAGPQLRPTARPTAES